MNEWNAEVRYKERDAIFFPGQDIHIFSEQKYSKKVPLIYLFGINIESLTISVESPESCMDITFPILRASGNIPSCMEILIKYAQESEITSLEYLRSRIGTSSISLDAIFFMP